MKHTTSPIVTGSSVIGMKYNGGILLACDTLASYGSLARFKHMKRIVKFGSHTLIGGSGEMSDFQQVEKYLHQIHVDTLCYDDGIFDTPRQTLNRLASLLYSKRSKMEPLWNDLVVAGFDESDGGFILGTTDKIGTVFEDDYVATGMGLHMALPLLRDAYRPGMTEAEARKVLENCMKVLFYRDCRALNRVTFAKVTTEGTVVEEPLTLQTEWSYQAFVDSNAGKDTTW